MVYRDANIRLNMHKDYPYLEEFKKRWRITEHYRFYHSP